MVEFATEFPSSSPNYDAWADVGRCIHCMGDACLGKWLAF